MNQRRLRQWHEPSRNKLPKNFFLFVVLALLATAAIGGCNGGGEAPSETPVAEKPVAAPMEEAAYMTMMSDSHAQLVEDAKAAAPNVAELKEEAKAQPEGEKWLGEHVQEARHNFVKVYSDYAIALKNVNPPVAHAEAHDKLIMAVDNFALAYGAMVDDTTEATTKAAQSAQAEMEAAIQPFLAKEDAPAPTE